MKTSHILFALTILVAVLALLFQGNFSSIKMTQENQPVGALSKLWLKMYDLKVTDSLSKPVKYIKVFGNGANTYLYVQKVNQPALFSIYPQGYTYQVNGDTLLLHIAKSYANIHLKQDVPIEQIAIQQGSLTVTGLTQDSISLFATQNSRLDLGKGWQREKQDSITRVRISASDRSKVNLNKVKMKTLSATVNDAVLSYEYTTQADSLSVTLKGKSTVISNQPDASVSQIKNLIVSGDKQYFKKEFAGQGVHVVVE